jgi:hypothetical protein
MDPTFARQFGMTVQSDILRRAAPDRQAPSSANKEQHIGRLPRLIARLRLGGRVPCVEPSPVGMVDRGGGVCGTCEQRASLGETGRAGA